MVVSVDALVISGFPLDKDVLVPVPRYPGKFTFSRNGTVALKYVRTSPVTREDQALKSLKVVRVADEPRNFLCDVRD